MFTCNNIYSKHIILYIIHDCVYNIMCLEKHNCSLCTTYTCTCSIYSVLYVVVVWCVFVSCRHQEVEGVQPESGDRSPDQRHHQQANSLVARSPSGSVTGLSADSSTSPIGTSLTSNSTANASHTATISTVSTVLYTHHQLITFKHQFTCIHVYTCISNMPHAFYIYTLVLWALF